MSLSASAKALRGALVCLIAGAIAGCAGQPTASQQAAEIRQERQDKERTENLNQQLAVKSAMTDKGETVTKDRESYELGGGDLIEITVLGVEELGREVRVSGDGEVTLPLIGDVDIGGKTTQEAANLIAERYAADYLQDPQVSVLIEEYRSQRITVLGSVKEPKVYSVQRQVGLLDALAMAGGVTEKAGRTVHVNHKVPNPDGEGKIRRNMVINLDELVSGQGVEDLPDLSLNDGAVLNVPEAGVVYVEGAVKEPGVYDIKGQTSVLKAISMAGGTEFSAKDSGIRVLRAGGSQGEPTEFGAFDIDELRNNPNDGLELNDGDVVVVETSTMKAALQGIGNTAKGVFGVGFSLNR